MNSSAPSPAPDPSSLRAIPSVDRAIREHRPGQPFVSPASLEEAGASADEPASTVQHDPAQAAEIFQGGGAFLRA